MADIPCAECVLGSVLIGLAETAATSIAAGRFDDAEQLAAAAFRLRGDAGFYDPPETNPR